MRIERKDTTRHGYAPKAGDIVVDVDDEVLIISEVKSAGMVGVRLSDGVAVPMSSLGTPITRVSAVVLTVKDLGDTE